jgi:hypothetical protein
MLQAFESALGFCLNMCQRALLPWSVSQLWPHTLVALFDALRIRVQGAWSWSRARSRCGRYRCCGHSLVALCDASGIRVRLGLVLELGAALALALVGVAVGAALLVAL